MDCATRSPPRVDWNHLLHCNGFHRTGVYTRTTVTARIDVNNGEVVLHFDGIQRASIDTRFAASTLLSINHSSHEQSPVFRKTHIRKTAPRFHVVRRKRIGGNSPGPLGSGQPIGPDTIINRYGHGPSRAFSCFAASFLETLAKKCGEDVRSEGSFVCRNRYPRSRISLGRGTAH